MGIRDLARAQTLSFWQLVVEASTLVVAIISLIVVIHFGSKTIPDKIENVTRSLLAERFTITSPIDGAEVEGTVLVRGYTPFSQLKHYVLVRPLELGEEWVDGPAMVHAGGTFAGGARLGSGISGVGKQFIIRVAATDSTLHEGPLTREPSDALFSRPVVVTRIR